MIITLRLPKFEEPLLRFAYDAINDVFVNFYIETRKKIAPSLFEVPEKYVARNCDKILSAMNNLNNV